MTDATAVKELLRVGQFQNITEIESGVIRGERRYQDTRYAIAYVDFRDNVVKTAENLRAVQERLFGADYFNNSDQLRWNSYLYILAGPRSLQSNAFREAKACIESNREYARKYVLSIDDMRDLLSDSLVSLPQSLIPTADVMSTWAHLLEAAQLNMLLDKPSRTRAVDLIEKGRASRHVKKQRNYELKPKDKSLSEGFLRHLRIKTFRPIHNNRAFDFADVNLIIGPNGSGKTSLLEAIEYFYCSHNRRDGAHGQYQLEGTVQFASQETETITSTAEVSRIKTRNFNWYRRENHQTKSIVDGFTRYNFLDTDAAFRISTEIDSDALSDDIRRLLIGPDASTLSDYLEKIKEDVDVRSKELGREIKYEVDRCDTLTQELARLKQIPTQASSLAKTYRTGLLEFGWKRETTDGGEFIHLPERSQIESISRSLAQVQAFTAVVPLSKAKLRFYISALEARLNSVEPLAVAYTHLNETVAKQTREQLQYKQMAELLAEWHAYCAADAPRLLRQIQTDSEDIRRARSQLGTLGSTSVPQLSSSYSLTTLDAAVRQNAEEVIIAQENLRNMERKQREVQSLQESIEIARRQLHDAARLLLAQSTQGVCPVCKTLHDPEELHAKVTALVDAETPTHVAEFAKLLQELKTREAHAIRSKKDLEILLNICLRLGCDHTTLTAEDVSTLLLGKQKALQLSVESLRIAEKAIEEFKLIGLSVGRFHELRLLILSNFKNDDKVDDMSVVEQAQREVQATVTELHKQVTEINKAINKVCAKVLPLIHEEQTKMSYAEPINPHAAFKLCEKELSLARAAFTHLEEIEKFIELPDDRSVPELVSGIAQAAEAFDCALHASQIERSGGVSVTKAQEAYDNANLTILDKREKIRRLKDAYKALSNILLNNSLDAATKNVFSSVRNQINDVFSRIHSPRQYEFSLSERTLLVARDSKAPWTLDQVSTGQRAAFALSIFLALNSTAASAPPVILIDDPIAYVDDLNVLSFLDYLRALVLNSHRQVFFATADTKVAALFEKKFSFLGARYRKLSLLPSG